MEDQPNHRTKQIQAMIGFKKSKMKDEKLNRGTTYEQLRNIADTLKRIMEGVEKTATKQPRKFNEFVLSFENSIRYLKQYFDLLSASWYRNQPREIFIFFKIIYYFSLLNIKLIPQLFHYFLSQIFLPIIFFSIRNFSIQKNLSISA